MCTDIYCNVRMEEKQCLLVIIGVTEEGKKDLVALEDGYRESELCWKGILRDLKRRGLAEGPQLAIRDEALGCQKTLEESYPETRWQRCWVHKTANILKRLPKGQQSKAKKKQRRVLIISSGSVEPSILKQWSVFKKIGRCC